LRQRVFEKFVHVRVPMGSGRPEGIGMGLSIAKGIVDAHGGRIWIEDGEGSTGTQVSFTVPVGDEEPEMKVGHERPAREDMRKMHGNILVNDGK